MRTKQLTVQAAAPAPIGADPIDEFIKNLPRKAEILAAKETRSAEKSVIYVTYKFEGRLCRALCSFTIGNSVSADIEEISCNWKGGAV